MSQISFADAEYAGKRRKALLKLSDPAMEEVLYEIASLRTFARLSLGEAMPDDTTILNFRHLLEASDLAEDILKLVNAHLARNGLLLKKSSIVDAPFIAAPSSSKNSAGARDPEMHLSKKGNQWHFGMKAHIAVDAESGLLGSRTQPHDSHALFRARRCRMSPKEAA